MLMTKGLQGFQKNHPNFLNPNNLWAWSRPELKGCVVCGSSERKHHARGICQLCTWREKAERERQRRKIDPKFDNHFKNRAAKASRTRRSLRPDVIEKDRKSSKRWYANNKEYRRDYYNKYYEEKKEYHLKRATRYRLGLSFDEIEFVHKRDNNSCRSCFKTRNEKRIDIHHIDGKGQYVSPEIRNNSPENLMLLCKSCHTFFDHMRRKDETNYYKKINSLISM